MSKFKVCPFCGHNPVVNDGMIVCGYCGVHMHIPDGDVEWTIKNWNRRAEVPKRIDGKPAGVSAEQFDACYEDDSDER